MAETVVGDGQVSIGAVLNAGDTQRVESSSQDIATGGKAFLTTINAGGTQTITYGTVDHATATAGDYATGQVGGYQLVSFGGVATNTILTGPNYPTDGQTFFNGRQDVAGGTATNTVVDGGHQAVFESFKVDGDGMIIPGSGVDGVAVASVLTNGGEQYVSYGGIARDTVIGNGGRQLLDGDNASEQNDHLLPGGSIVIAQLPFDPQASAVSFNQTSGSLTITEGSVSKTIQLAGSYAGQTFVAGPATALYGTEVHLLCFARGTRITTVGGDQPIETLRIGDLVVTVGGTPRPIRWLGSATTLVHRESAPVIVHAGALADGIPTRPLRVTPGHSFLFGDVLIPIGQLVNGVSIIIDQQLRSLQVYHVGLDRHGILLAEGAPAESYRDDGNGLGFTSSTGEPTVPRAMPSCAPVVTGGPLVERTRARLTARAAALSKCRSPAASRQLSAVASWLASPSRNAIPAP